MLSEEQKVLIPRTTRQRWDEISHEDYFGYEMVKDYIADLDHIKEVLTSKHIKQGIRFMCALSYGYKDVVASLDNGKKLLRENAEKLTFGIERVARYGKFNKTDVCSLFGVSKDWFYRHRKKNTCQKSILGKCFKQHPNQLTLDEVAAIETIVCDPSNRTKTKTTLFFDSIRKGILTCGMSTFFKYADLVGYQKPKKPETEKRKNGFRATRPLEWLQVDVTHVQTQNDGVQYVAFVKDNFSKALLGYKSSSQRPDSGFIRDLFEETFIEFNLFDATDPINILSDGGSENKGHSSSGSTKYELRQLFERLLPKPMSFRFPIVWQKVHIASTSLNFFERNIRQMLKSIFIIWANLWNTTITIVIHLNILV